MPVTRRRNPDRVFFELEPEFRDAERAAAVVLRVPYDHESSWIRGADLGADAILEASTYVERYDLETATEPFRHGIATLAPFEFEGPPEALAKALAGEVGALLDAGRLPVVVGGNHSVPIGAMVAAAERFDDLTVLQIDAHGDTRESYHGSTHDHACVMARARELCPIVQVGIRSVDSSEVPLPEPERVFFAHEIAARNDESWIERVVDLLTASVYVTIDMDAFDPGIVPATGTPEPGGLDWYEINGLLARVARRRRVVGFDVVEVLPGHPPSAFTAAKLIYRFLAEIFAAHPPVSRR